ncbi:glycosyltransferase family 2 protein|jgi:glycosyltransferase involved in cell wall biosynthesis|uniref:glycosyltransferase family 2 protein n=1 Tax=Noviherbaspirillum sp. L7-7A TaxID=2850560 RepID=UPI001C2C3D0A|nr:glycosyltransferase family 2 protein [Noviherbaspirillum sp. L7-7A]MBV0879071.1 glycosyltransferase family 2 protein [Noviherbaspirillum sp. L7-7A]
MFLSVVIPVMNEEGNIALLTSRIAEALAGIEHEVIFVDDGSSDRTVAEIEAYGSPVTRVLVLNRNYGQTTAMAAGIDAAEGELIVMLDGDMQNDPRDIPLMIQCMQEGNWDVVAGIRAKRQDGFLLRKVPSKIANWLIRRSTGVHMKDYGCTLKLFRSDVAKSLGLYGELHRYIPVLASMYGARMTQMEVRHHSRHAGVSKYGLGRTFKVASDLMLMLFFQKYGQRPMHLFGGSGLALFLVGVLINLYLLVEKIMVGSIGGRPLLFVGVLLTFTGIQLITTGFMADLIMRTYYESQNKKPYNIKKQILVQPRA